MQKSDELNIDLNAKDAYGETALYYACEISHLEIVELILQKSPDLDVTLNSRNNLGKTPLDIAVMKSRSEIGDFIRSKLPKRPRYDNIV